METLWSDDGFVVRFPDTDAPPDPALLFPAADEVERLLVKELAGTALFAARFREVASRALLLPRRRAGVRTPLWRQRKRAADLLAVTARHGSFPAILETYRECLRDVFDVPALVDTLARIEDRSIRVATCDMQNPSPFAASVLFSYTANFIYDGDAPLAERRAQALLVDHAQLRDLLGEVELREMLDATASSRLNTSSSTSIPGFRAGQPTGCTTCCSASVIWTPKRSVRGWRRTPRRRGLRSWSGQGGSGCRWPERRASSPPRTAAGIATRSVSGSRPACPRHFWKRSADRCGISRCVTAVRMVRSRRARWRSATVPQDAAEAALFELASSGRLVQGEFRPGRTGREWCEAEVLRRVRQGSLARLRHEVEPVDAATLGRLTTTWQGVTLRREGLDGLLDIIEQLQGAPLAASVLEREILPARIDGYRPGDLDLLIGAGEVLSGRDRATG